MAKIVNLSFASFWPNETIPKFGSIAQLQIFKGA